MDDQEPATKPPAIALEKRIRKGDVGRDPRRMTLAELAQAGIKRRGPLETIHATCLHCVGSRLAVRHCADVACPSWPLRMGSNPWRLGTKPWSPEQKKRRARLLAEARQKRHQREASGDPKNSPEQMKSGGGPDAGDSV